VIQATLACPPKKIQSKIHADKNNLIDKIGYNRLLALLQKANRAPEQVLI
jgi:hypothetical protein